MDIHKSINVMHDINKIEATNHMSVSTGAEEAFDKTQHPVMTKTLSEWAQGNAPQQSEGRLQPTQGGDKPRATSQLRSAQHGKPQPRHPAACVTDRARVEGQAWPVSLEITSGRVGVCP